MSGNLSIDEQLERARQLKTEQNKKGKPIKLDDPTINKIGNEIVNYLKEEAKTKEDEPLNEEETNETLDYLKRIARTAALENKYAAIKEGAEIGLELRNKINEGKFEGGTFYTVLILALIGDFIDLLTLGTIGYFLDKIIMIALFFVFFLKVSAIKKYLIKRFIWPSIIKFIPLISTFPSYTISTIMLKLKVDKENKKLENQLREVEEKYKIDSVLAYE